MKLYVKKMVVIVLIGLIFPAMAIFIDLKKNDLAFNFSSIGKIHRENPIHFIIDSAPVILCVLAMVLFMQAEKLKKNLNTRINDISIQRKNLLRQMELVSQQKEEMIKDIEYARHIQHAILPGPKFLQVILPEHFVLNLPKQIVSGDFYWASKINGKTIVVVADATGHGLAGSFMHMLGVAFLNELVNSNDICPADKVLADFREYIIQTLRQQGKTGEASNGFDMVLCIFDFENKKLQFAGANNSIYLIRNGELMEYKANRMPVGIHITQDKPFHSQGISLQSKDCIYLFSDGYADQFGGKKGKKMRYRVFQETLLEVSKLEMNDQQKELKKRFKDWKGDLEQVDDVMIMGIKI